MSGLTLRLKAPATERINLSDITPAKLAALSSHDIARLNVGFDKGGLALGDAFDISGDAGDTLTIEGSGAALDFAAPVSTAARSASSAMPAPMQVARCPAASSKSGGTPETSSPPARRAA